jgi:NADH dehydrogenase [ubiquinone] 1 alpha subcomplex assembly factor 5
MTPTPFNRALLRQRRDRAAAWFSAVNFLKLRAADMLADRLFDMAERFPLALDLGSHVGELSQAVTATGKTDRIIRSDFSLAMLSLQNGLRVQVDEEFIPFGDNTFDLIASALSLHWVNDLPGCLIQCQRALKANGLFLAVMPGARSLIELRSALLEEKTISPRISPFLDVRDAGALLQRAGFALPVVDSEIVTLTYREPMTLLRELQQMGESNALNQQHKGLTGKSFWPRVMQRYTEQFASSDGKLPVTMEFITLTGWKPHASQQQPARRGSGKISLKDALQ